MNAPRISPPLLPLPEVARRLGISIRSLRGLISSAALAVVRPTPRRVLVSEADLEAFVNARRSPAVL